MSFSAKNISKSYGEKKILFDFSYDFRAGGLTSVTGASGCGKTTLLLILAGIVKPDAGSVIPGNLRKSMVFQENRLCENLTAAGNIRLLPNKPEKAEIIEGLEKIGLSGSENQPVRELSGGMKRRTALLRALLAEYDVLLLDEPFKGLDERTKLLTMEYCKQKTAGKTVILVTHDEDETSFFGGEKILLQ